MLITFSRLKRSAIVSNRNPAVRFGLRFKGNPARVFGNQFTESISPFDNLDTVTEK